LSATAVRKDYAKHWIVARVLFDNLPRELSGSDLPVRRKAISNHQLDSIRGQPNVTGIRSQVRR
jgi:hypothetical protein